MEEEEQQDIVEERPYVPRMVKELRTFNNPGRLEQEDAIFCFKIGEENEVEPTAFQEAWHHENAENREKWRDAIRLEFRQMIKNGVWKNRTMNQLPYG